MGRIEEIKKEINDLDKKSKECHIKISALYNEKESLIKQKIFDEKLLNQFSYVYDKYESSYIAFKLIIKSKDLKRDKFEKLVLSGWDHSSFDLGDGAEVYYSDGEFGLRFDSDKQGYNFIKRHDLQIDFSNLSERKKELEESLQASNDLLTSLGK